MLHARYDAVENGGVLHGFSSGRRDAGAGGPSADERAANRCLRTWFSVSSSLSRLRIGATVAASSADAGRSIEVTIEDGAFQFVGAASQP